MSVLSIQEAEINRIQGVLPRVVKTLLGSHHMEYYLGNGKDGFVFRMFNPDNAGDRYFERFALKMWEKGFKYREQEIETQREAALLTNTGFRTPRINFVDQASGLFIMDRIMGETVYKAVFTKKRRISMSLYEGLCSAFDSLNKSGIVHQDAHPGNYMLTDLQLIDTPSGAIIDDAEIWIIDFGHSTHGQGNDSKVIQRDLKNKVAPESL